MVVRAWDLAVATMKVGEKSRFYCKDIYVYTDELAQSADSPQQNYIIYDIELIRWQGSVYISVHLLMFSQSISQSKTTTWTTRLQLGPPDIC